MLYLIPTKNGVGVEIWGTYDDIQYVYEIIQDFWGQESNMNKLEFASRDNAISGFSHEIRKTHEGERLKRNSSHYSNESIEHFGCRFTWVHIIITLSALRYNMRFKDTNKLHVSLFLQFEYWLEKSARQYDSKGADRLIPFFEGAINGGAVNIYQHLLTIDYDFVMLKGGKRAFRKLPELLRRAVQYTPEFMEYEEFLRTEAIRQGCSTFQLEIQDDVDYDKINW